MAVIAINKIRFIFKFLLFSAKLQIILHNYKKTGAKPPLFMYILPLSPWRGVGGEAPIYTP